MSDGHSQSVCRCDGRDTEKDSRTTDSVIVVLMAVMSWGNGCCCMLC